MSGELAGAATAVALSRVTMRNIKQNLFWAFAYNIILIPLRRARYIRFRHPSVSDAGGGRHGFLFGLRGHERAAPAPVRAAVASRLSVQGSRFGPRAGGIGRKAALL